MTPHERARALILEHGRNATSYQILNPGFELWFTPPSDSCVAVVGYVLQHGVRVVGGIPICADACIAAAAAAFERDAAAAGHDVAYFAVEGTGYAQLRNPTHASFVIGAQPVWRPEQLADTIEQHPSLRAQLNRAANKGVRITRLDVRDNATVRELHACLDGWLEQRGLPPLHFLVEPNTLDRIGDREIFLARRNDVVIGFLVATPIRARNGWLIEQNVRSHDAPNGTAESLLHAAARWMAAGAFDVVTLGLSPLSRHAPRSDQPPPALVRIIFSWLRMHGRRFYNFEGLDTFKGKFRPSAWEPVYALVHNGHALRALIATGAAFGGMSAAPFVLRVLAHAAAQEWRGVRR